MRDIVKQESFQRLDHHPALTMEEFRAITPGSRTLVPNYVDTYVPVDLFAA